MEAENVINLLDSYWYDLDFFKRTKPTKINEITETPASNNSSNSDHYNTPELPTIHTKCPSFKKTSSNSSKSSDFSASPISVLQSPKLKPIYSGKQTLEFEDSKSENQTHEEQTPAKSKGNNVISRSRRKKRLSKSLSDLEFEELKGFMDLGFVFSEEDRDNSTLASIIPGLQKFGNKTRDGFSNVYLPSTNNVNKSGVVRPYLSEAWEELEKKKKESKNELNWKVPEYSSQIDMKGYLKSWAHNVASTVKL